MAHFGKMDAVPQIQLVLGPMYSGKTSELMRRVKRYRHAKKNCCIIKYAHDTRYSEECVSSHDRQTLPAFPCLKLGDIAYDKLKEYDIIAIDEGQFFPDVVEFSETAANDGKVIIIAALDGDFRRKPFGRVLELMPMAEKIDKLTAVCINCSGDASFTKRTVASTEIELIGGEEAYVPVCRSCYHSVGTPGSNSPQTTLSKTRAVSEGALSPSSSPEDPTFIATPDSQRVRSKLDEAALATTTLPNSPVQLFPDNLS